MEAVSIEVGDVVEEVERARNETERRRHRCDEDEWPYTARHRRLRRVGDSEEPGEEHDAVLSPLVDPQRPQPRVDRLLHLSVLHLMIPQSSEWYVQTGLDSLS